MELELLHHRVGQKISSDRFQLGTDLRLISLARDLDLDLLPHADSFGSGQTEVA